MTKAPPIGASSARSGALLVEANGMPVGLVVEGANRHDKELAELGRRRPIATSQNGSEVDPNPSRR
jgi:hypothetical protein